MIKMGGVKKKNCWRQAGKWEQKEGQTKRGEKYEGRWIGRLRGEGGREEGRDKRREGRRKRGREGWRIARKESLNEEGSE